ncbi:DUF2975 domain-containing protein [Tunicatimonas pelagia]|uniref:DUF2975 domain-containing protein n=1 Tax=Tunicatimonas pelagia TaxID=931531 RepID=UPI0026670760|nr:DUF2975 domain-containing protein [Tunicatimonas pelagia]WKN43704.1 DUF2975 domain-containing protein [Tunicatimonas pelagia]
MRKIPLLTAWKWVLVLFQLLFIVIPIALVISIYQMEDNGPVSTKLRYSGISFLPEDQKIINGSESVSIVFKKDPTVSPEILISETEILLEMEVPMFGVNIIYLAILPVFLAILGLEQLKRMIKTVESGTPFVRINVWRIYILSTLFFLVPLIANLSSYLQKRWFIANFEFSGMILKDNSTDFLSMIVEGISFDFSPWFVPGVLLLTIGKILEQGIKIQEEQDLTV